VNAELAHQFELTERTHRERALGVTARIRIVRALGPLTVAAGIGWALAQPYRITLLHPAGQGFWWLLSEPPLFVVAAGLVFHLLIAPGLVEDLEEAGAP
jgi:hypothetical protein